jgi:CubicO group peptidase (beta-lactamase class C family)
LAPVFSSTKFVSALVMAVLADRGALSYDDRVADLWPDFAAHGKGELTIAQALSHQAGLPGFPEPIDPALWLDPPALAAALAALAPLWPPGTASGYHPLTWGYIIGEIVRRATERSLGTILRGEICAPLGIDFHIGLNDSEFARVAVVKKPPRAGDFGELTPIKRAAFLTPWANPKRNDENWRRIEIPSANGHGTARALAEIAAIVACGGQQIISAQGLAAFSATRISGPDLVLPFDLDWRSGVLGNAQKFYGPDPDALGHSGSGGSCVLADRAARLSAAYVMNKQSPFIMGDPRALRLIAALYECL